jgi:hypothetical protein
MIYECISCGEHLPEASFSKKSASKTGRSSKCKACHNKYVREVWYPANRERHKDAVRSWEARNQDKVIAARYKLDVLSVGALLGLGIDECQVCLSKKDLVFDHCHESQKPRGILCRHCNTLIGRLGDSLPAVKRKVENIIQYLEARQI